MWAKWISGIFHPLVMPITTLALVFLLDQDLQSMPQVFIYMGVVVLINTLAPAISIFMLHRRGHLSDLDIRNRRERSTPFMIVLVYFVMTFLLLRSNDSIYIPLIYLDMWAGLMGSIALALLITRWFKISMHMLAQGGVLGTLMGVQLLQMNSLWELNSILILIAGFVGFARIELGVHRHIEVYTGYLLGFLVCFFAVVFGLGG